MSDYKLIIESSTGKKQTLSLNKEKMMIGRDAKCEVVLDEEGISRRHATVLFKHGALYIENLSATGQVLRDGTAVEFCELAKDEKIQIGSFKIYWTSDSKSEISAFPSDFSPVQASAPAMILSEEEVRPVENESFLADPVAEDPIESEAEPVPEGEADLAEPNSDDFLAPSDLIADVANQEIKADAGVADDDLFGGTNSGSQQIAVAPQNADSVDLESGNEPDLGVESGTSASSGASNASSGGATKITDAEMQPVLKILRGDEAGQEYKLPPGSSWLVGRGAQCDIQIDNSKLSREHFKIIKIGAAYRIEDLGSANGTRLNGAGIQDSPLNSFDTIQIGALEIQFVVVNPNVDMASGALDSALHSATSAEHRLLAAPGQGEAQSNASTNVAALPSLPANYQPNYSSPPPNNYAVAAPTPYTANSSAAYGRIELTNNGRPLQAMGGGGGTSAKSGSGGIGGWWNSQAGPRKILIILVVLFVGGVIYSQNQPLENIASETANENSEGGGREPAATTPGASNPSDPLAGDNAATEGEYSEDFKTLSQGDKSKVEALYVKADRAAAEKDWKTAFEASSEVARMVKRYKRNKDIQFEAQEILNAGQIGLISKSLNNVDDAASDNMDKIGLLLEAGNKALEESRFDDASEAFSKALNLDPTNAMATQGLAKATAKDLSISVDAPNAAALVGEEDPETTAQRDFLEAYKLKYKDARSMLNGGRIGAAYRTFKELNSELKVQLNDFESLSRSPASIPGELVTETKKLQIRAREGFDTARTQLLVEYQAQLADADEFTNNRQYAQARDIFDRVLRAEPNFEEAREARSKLYAKIITEAKNLYQEALIYESVGELTLATEGFSKSRDLVTNVENPLALEYYKKAMTKLGRLDRSL